MKNIILLLFFICVSCNSTRNISSIKDNEESMPFKILKIKNEESFYIIYAQRNDSIFQIFSPKNISSEYCVKIKKNGQYNLSLKKILPPDSILGIPYHSNPGVRTEWDKYIKKKYHYRVYNANNLNGLCIENQK